MNIKHKSQQLRLPVSSCFGGSQIFMRQAVLDWFGNSFRFDAFIEADLRIFSKDFRRIPGRAGG
jgi:hypothetical protein